MWLFKNTLIRGHKDLFPECTDFVYVIKYITGELYIGKKTVRSIRKKKPTKAQLAKRKNYSRKELTDLPFVNYVGSHEHDDLEIAEKEILYQCSTKKAATYLEAALLFHHDAIFDPIYLNKNISGVHFDNSLDGLLGEEDVYY